MKKIKTWKIFESKSDFTETCRMAFIDFIDSGSRLDNSGPNEISIFILCTFNKNTTFNTIDELNDSKKNEFEVTQDIKTAIDRIKDDFEVGVNIGVRNGGYFITLINGFRKGDFFIYNDSNVFLNLHSLKRILGLRYCDIKFYNARSSKYSSHIAFEFSDSEALEDCKDAIIKYMGECKIGDDDYLNIETKINHRGLSKYEIEFDIEIETDGGGLLMLSDIRFGLNPKYNYSI